MPDSLNASRRQGRILAFAAFLITTFALLLVAGRADAAVTASNTNSITIADAASNGTATQEESDIPVSGVVGNISHVSVTLKGFAHACPIDADILLVGPQGQKTLLMSDTGDCADDTTGTGADPQQPKRAGINLVFDDSGIPVPCISSKTPLGAAPTAYAPTDMSPATNGGTLTSTGGPICDPPTDPDHSPPHDLANVFSGVPAGPVTTHLSTFSGTNPNGTWRLVLVDQYHFDDGHISGGWTVNFTIAPPTVAKPTISGTPQVGQTLSLTAGAVTAGGAPSFQWNQCDLSGVSCVPIAGANGVTYAPTANDVGHALTVTETASNEGGPGSATSSPTAAVAAAPAPPVTPSKTPAHISTSGLKTKQKVLTQHGILATLTTSISGKLVATATVSVPKLAKVYRFTTVRATVVAGNRTTVLLKLSRSGLNAIKKALGKHKKLSAKLTLVVTTASGARTTVHKTIRLVR